MNLVERVKGIIVSPKTEWPVIAGEPGDAGYLFSNYVAILAAIPAVCGFIGGAIIAVWNAWKVLTSHRRRLAKLWSVVLAIACLVVLYVAIVSHLIGFSANY